MEYRELLDAIDGCRSLIVTAIRSGEPETVVPTCPELTLEQLAFHIGEFSSFWTHVVCEATGREKPEYPPDPGWGGRAAWVDALVDHLVTELRFATPLTRCWTWFEPDQSVAFVASRACHELTVHRVDVQLAVHDVAEPVDAAVAADGIEEIFLMLGGYGVDGVRGTPGNGQTLSLLGTDHEPAEWFLQLDQEGPVMRRVDAPADLVIRASVSDLEMLLYQRPTTCPVDWFGDRTVLDAFHGEFTFA